MLIGSAPVSWGVYEVRPDGGPVPWHQVLDEIAATGYEGTELGPYGYLPTDPAVLRYELGRRNLRLTSAFHPLEPRGDAGQELARAVEVAGTLAALGCGAIVLACAGTPDRDAVAGRAAPEHALTGDAWRAFVDLVRRAAEAAAERGLRAYFHNHAATYVETPDEVGRLLEAVPAAAMGLCLDTGHYAFGGGEPAQALRDYRERIGYLHLKDLRRAALEDARHRGLSFLEAVEAGVFCELGRGDAGIEGVVRALDASGYEGWAIVEQDRVVTPSTPPDEPRRSAQISRDWLRQVLGR